MHVKGPVVNVTEFTVKTVKITKYAESTHKGVN